MSSCEISIVLRPDYEDDQVEDFVPAPRSVPTEPFTLSIIDNGKPKAKQLLGELASLLEDRFPIANVELVSNSALSATAQYTMQLCNCVLPSSIPSVGKLKFIVYGQTVAN